MGIMACRRGAWRLVAACAVALSAAGCRTTVADFDGDGTPDDRDCAPEDAERYPGSPEILADGIDQDCDGVDGHDADGDGFAVDVEPRDCADDNRAVHPGADEDCSDGTDNDCDNAVDLNDGDCQDGDDDDDDTGVGDDDTGVGDDDIAGDDDSATGDDDSATGDDDSGDDDSATGDDDSVEDDDTVSDDADGDGQSEAGGDCDDGDATRYAGAPESCDAIDSDCDGTTVDEFPDFDGDGAPDCVDPDDDGDGDPDTSDCDAADPANHSTGVEVMDGGDNDCDGLADSADPDLREAGPAGMTFLQLPAGTFTMGCTAGQSGCEADESPAHTVTLTRGFWLGETEVTQGDWQALAGNNPSYFGASGAGADCGADCPVETVNWYEALALANLASAEAGLLACYNLGTCTSSLGNDLECPGVTVATVSGSPLDCEGYRLPTEAEWEYAARARTDLGYAGSDTLDGVAWYIGNSGNTTHPVATKAPNGWGLYDLSGNVWEWTWDRYGFSYYGSSPASDPEGPASGSYRVRRGGDWYFDAAYCRVASRIFSDPGNRTSGYGFRLAKTIP